MLYQHTAEECDSPHLRTSGGHKTLLAPISEVRKVTFAAQYVEDKEFQVYTPVDVVRVRFMPHISEYDSEEKGAIWYTSAEIKSMKQQAYQDVDRRRTEQRMNQTEFSGDIRGLERLVYKDSNQCGKLRFEALRALLLEQYQQRCWMYGTHNPGGIINERESFIHVERIREVVVTKGQSVLSQQIAQLLAHQDEAEADEYLERRIETEEEEYIVDDDREDKDTVNPYTGVKQDFEKTYEDAVLTPIMGRKKNKNHTNKSSGTENCCWCVKAVEVVGRSLILHAFLRPFLNIHHGDAMLDSTSN